MMTRLIRLMMLFFFSVSMLTAQEQDLHRQQAAFVQKISNLCGKRYAGVAVFPDPAPEPFRGATLVMEVRYCTATEVHIPFLVGEDASRTWQLTLSPSGLLFKHDHRHADGTPDDITNYGGYADARGNAWQQFFPADADTAALIPAAATNAWEMRLSEDGRMFSYILRRDGKLRFQADFDLSRELGRE
jgi:hypothetical protein